MSQPQPIAVAVVAHEGRVLVGRRGADQSLAGLCEFPGGKIAAGETAAAAAIRECREETGMDVAVVGEFPAVDHCYEELSLRIHFFRCRPIDPSAPPAEPFRWISVDELDRHEFPAANASVLAILRGESRRFE